MRFPSTTRSLASIVISCAIFMITGCTEEDETTPEASKEKEVEDGKAPPGTFLKLFPGETLVDEREYAALESRTYTLETEEPLIVGYATSYSREMEGNIQPQTQLGLGEVKYAAKIEQVGTDVFSSSSPGHQITAEPIDGKIIVKVTNFCDNPLFIRITKESAKK